MNTLSLCRDLFGNRIRPDYERKIQRFLANPTEDGWDEIHGIIIAPHLVSIWQAMIAYDPTFPRTGPTTNERHERVTGWQRIPTPFELLSAIKQCVIKYADKEGFAL